MSQVYCFHCKYLKKRFENYFDGKFMKGGPEGARWSERKFLMPHALCRRKECFKIIDGKRIRVIGQAQLNENYDCPHYKKKRWWSIL
jgi:hypothetical protein